MMRFSLGARPMETRQIVVDKLEIRRLRREQGLSVDDFLKLARMGRRTLREIESAGRATPRMLQNLARALACTCGEADLKPVVVAGTRIAQYRKTEGWTEVRLARETANLQHKLGELGAVSEARIREIEASPSAPAMHHEWRLLALALGREPHDLLATATSQLRTTVPPSRDELRAWIDGWIEQVVTRQDSNSGSFSGSWNTAQVVVGLLSHPERVVEYHDVIRHALTYLDRSRVPDPRPDPATPQRDQGWRHFDHILMPPVTEVTCWAFLAQLLAWRQGIRWNDVPHPERAERLLAELRVVLARQFTAPGHPQDGGFCPTATPSGEHVRTYTTVMALSALAIACQTFGRHPGLALPSGVTEAVQRGLSWLFRHLTPERGWVPNPGRNPPDEAIYPGLTAQVLHALTVLQRTHERAWLAWYEGKLRRTERAFLEDLARRLPGCDIAGRMANMTVDVLDTILSDPPVVLEAMTFYWWPWTLAFLAAANERTCAAADGHRQHFRDGLVNVLGKHPNGGRGGVAPQWEVALLGECLYCLARIQV